METPTRIAQHCGHFHSRKTSRLRALYVWIFILALYGNGQAAEPHPKQTIAELAQKALDEGKTDLALTLYAKAVKQTPGWTEGWWRYGGLLYETRQYPAAKQAFARLTTLAPNNSLGFALLGLCEYEEQDWNNATLHLNKSLNRGSLPAEISQSAAYHLGLSLMRLRDRDGALLILKLLLHQAPEYPGLSLAIGAAELEMQTAPSPDDALFQAAILAGEGTVSVARIKAGDAEKSYRQLVTRFPNLPYAHICFGEFLEYEHRDDEAAQEFRAETQVSPDNPVAWIWLGRVAVVQQDASTARAAAQRALALDPSNPLAYLIEGRGFMLEHRWEQAVDPLIEAEKRVPNSSEVHFALATTYAALHRSEAAAAERKLFLETSEPEGGAEGSHNR